MNSRSVKSIIILTIIMIFIYLNQAFAVDDISPMVFVQYFQDNNENVTVSMYSYKNIKTAESGWTSSTLQEPKIMSNNVATNYTRYYLKKTFTKAQRTTDTRTLEVYENGATTNRTMVEYALDVSFDVDFNSKKLFIAPFWGDQTYKKTQLTNYIENGIYASNDGITWKFLGMTPLGVRDLGLMYHNGVFYAVGTCTLADKGLVSVYIFKSTDLVSWTSEANAKYEFDPTRFANPFPDENGSYVKNPANFSDKYQTWVGSGVQTWGPKWVVDGDNVYIICSINDTTVDFRQTNYFTEFLLPITGYGTNAQEKDIQYKNLQFANPMISMDLRKEDGTTSVDAGYEDYGTDMANSRSQGRIGGNQYRYNNKLYLFIKRDQSNPYVKDQRLEMYTAGSVDGIYKRIGSTLKYNSNNNLTLSSSNIKEKANITINTNLGEVEPMFEGNYICFQQNKNVFLTDHYLVSTNITESGYNYNDHDTRVPGMYYAYMSINNENISISNLKPVSIMNTELWKTKYHEDLTSEYLTSGFAPRNAATYEVKSTDAATKLKSFASNFNVAVKYYDGEKDLMETIPLDTNKKTVTLIKTDWDVTVATKVATLKLHSTHPLKSATVNGNAITIDYDEITINYDVRTPGTYTFVLKDVTNNTRTFDIVVDKVICIQKINAQEYTGEALTAGVATVSIAINNATSTKYTPINYTDNVNPGVAKCQVNVDGKLITLRFDIRPIVAENVRVYINSQGTARVTWSNPKCNYDTEMLQVFKKDSNDAWQKHYLMRIYDKKQTSVYLLENLDVNTSYNIQFYPLMMITDVDGYGYAIHPLDSKKSKAVVKPSDYSAGMNVSKTSLATGETITLNVDLSHTSGPYDRPLKYAFGYMHNNKWTTIKDYSTDTQATYQFIEPGTYTLFLRAKDDYYETPGTSQNVLIIASAQKTITVTGEPLDPNFMVQSSGTYYLSLNEAYQNTASTDTIKVLNNIVDTSAITISSGKTITLNLNGKTITKRSNSIIVEDGGSLTVLGNGTIKTDGTDTISNLFRVNGGLLNLEKGTYTNQGHTTGYYTVVVAYGGTVNIKNATLTCNLLEGLSPTGARIVRMNESADINIIDSTLKVFDITNSMALESYANSAGYPTGTLVVSGSTLESIGSCLGIDGSAGYPTGASVFIEDNSEIISSTNHGIKYSSNGNLKIVDSKITAKNNCIYSNEGSGDITIVGNSELKSTSGSTINQAGNNIERYLFLQGGNITSNNDSAIVWKTDNTLIIGKRDGIVRLDSPMIVGKKYGINGNVISRFYDGTIKGETASFTGTFIDLEMNSTLKSYEEGNYKVMQLSSRSLGDIDSNGEINIIDVRLLLQAYINNSNSSEIIEVGDMDLNGEISIIDVRLLLQMYINGAEATSSVTPIRFLMVGNSKTFMNEVRRFTVEVAQNEGYVFSGPVDFTNRKYNYGSEIDFFTNISDSQEGQYFSATRGGYPLERTYKAIKIGGEHLGNTDEDITSTLKYLGGATPEQLDNLTVDVAILQELYEVGLNGQTSDGRYTYVNGIKLWADLLTRNNPNVVIYARNVWGLVNSPDEEQEREYNNLLNAINTWNAENRDKIPIRIINDGPVIREARKQLSDIEPNVVFCDNTHQTLLGAYGVALTINQEIFGINPMKSNIYIPEPLTQVGSTITNKGYQVWDKAERVEIEYKYVNTMREIVKRVGKI